jgi:hypothetical protein
MYISKYTKLCLAFGHFLSLLSLCTSPQGLTSHNSLKVKQVVTLIKRNILLLLLCVVLPSRPSRCPHVPLTLPLHCPHAPIALLHAPRLPSCCPSRRPSCHPSCRPSRFPLHCLSCSRRTARRAALPPVVHVAATRPPARRRCRCMSCRSRAVACRVAAVWLATRRRCLSCRSHAAARLSPSSHVVENSTTKLGR